MPGITELNEEELKNWNLLRQFQDELADVIAESDYLHPSWHDSRRKLDLMSYLSLYLFSLYNPIIDSMRMACKATELEDVCERISHSKVSLGSFSEAQHLVDVELLEKVFNRFVKKLPIQEERKKLSKGVNFSIIDSSIWNVANRLNWASWRKRTSGHSQNGDSAIRLHLVFDWQKNAPKEASLTSAKTCERKQWKLLAKPGQTYIGDRYYGHSYGILEKMINKKIGFLVRMRKSTKWVVEKELPLSQEDKDNKIEYSAIVKLGSEGKGPKVRIIIFSGSQESIILATTLDVEEFNATEARLLYKNRWEIEYFFHWLKCILKNRNWFCESPEGMKIQMYLALIAAVILMLFTGKRPNKSTMKIIQFYLSGWANPDELKRELKKSFN